MATKAPPETGAERSEDAASAGAPVAIEVRDVVKNFRVPGAQVDSLKESVLHPLARRQFTTFRALQGVSFDVRQGEFFGIVGRNGSGKSTLLKILASIYRADAGQIRIAGRLAPFIELGVGFNLDLSARENVALNGVMMGLSRAEARRRLDSVLEFAELEEFVDLKLKNYSSGMLVRLGFSVMIQTDADVMLIDEILAVGDAAFQQKCADVFHGMRGSGKTVVLVTHDMGSVEEYCHRAMLLEEGRILEVGDPRTVGRRYLRLNFEKPQDVDRSEESDEVRLIDIWTENEAGEHVTTVMHGDDIRIGAIVEARQDIPRGVLGLVINNADGVHVFTTATVVDTPDHLLPGGRRIKLSARIENPLGAGHYFVDFAVHRNENALDNALWVSKAIDFVVIGAEEIGGLVALDHSVQAETLDD